MLPSGWLDADIGNVGVVGSATYASNAFTVNGGGQSFYVTSADAFHFAYVPLSGDGSISARVANVSTGSPFVGAMIRETLTASSNYMLTNVRLGQVSAVARTNGGNSSNSNTTTAVVPTWVRVVRSGNSFTGYSSPDGINWVQVGSTQTISMAQNVYVGLAVSGSTSQTYSGTFNNVSVSSVSSPAPAIATVSATTGSVGSQVVIAGSGFGATQGNSVVWLGSTAASVNSWSDTSVTITVPTGATSGDLVVSVAPGMNDSNPIYFTVTGNPLPSGWLDADIGNVGVVGSATYASNAFTVNGGGQSFYVTSADAFHFAYVPLSGDGSISARVANVSTGSPFVGAMIRETLTASSNYMLTNVRLGQVGCYLPNQWWKLIKLQHYDCCGSDVGESGS